MQFHDQDKSRRDNDHGARPLPEELPILDIGQIGQG